MTKSELIKKLMEANESLYLKDVRVLVDAIFDEISASLERGDRIELRGFGAFSIRKRKPRAARNPKTNERVNLGERSVVYFRAGKGLREALNKNVPPVNSGPVQPASGGNFGSGSGGGVTFPRPY